MTARSESAQPGADLTGRTFGDWTVTGLSHVSADRTRFWHVTCACGAARVQRSWVLTLGKSLRCGDCSARELSKLHRQRQAERWVGTEAGGWIIVACTGSVMQSGHKITMWACRCTTCGAVVDIPRTDVHKATMPVCRHGVSPITEED